MSEDDVNLLHTEIARLHERFEAMNDRLKRLEQIIYVTCGGALLGLAYAALTHQLRIP